MNRFEKQGEGDAIFEHARKIGVDFNADDIDGFLSHEIMQNYIELLERSEGLTNKLSEILERGKNLLKNIEEVEKRGDKEQAENFYQLHLRLAREFEKIDLQIAEIHNILNKVKPVIEGITLRDPGMPYLGPSEN